MRKYSHFSLAQKHTKNKTDLDKPDTARGTDLKEDQPAAAGDQIPASDAALDRK